MPSPSPPRWVRPLNRLESLFHMLQGASGSMLVCYTLTLASLQPLTLQCITLALQHLARKVQLLRLSVQNREDEDKKPWFVELEPDVIDLEVVSWEHIDATVKEVSTTPCPGYPHPLWKARLSTANETDADGRHVSKLIFGFNHSLTDGFSSFRIIGHFMNILNSVIAGDYVDDSKQLCCLTDTETCTGETVMKIIGEWQSNPEEKVKMWETFGKMKSSKPLLLEVFPQKGKTVRPETLTLRHDFSKDQTRAFLDLCKQHKVSCHAAFFTAAQIAVIEMLQTRGVQQEKYDFVTNHTINNRRFYSENIDSSNHFGLSISVLPTEFRLSNDAKDHFWATCQEYAKTFSSGIQEIHSLKLSLYLVERYLANPALMAEAPKEYFITSNMGECTDIITGNFAKTEPEAEEEKQVVVTDITRRVSSHSEGIILSHVLQTFKGKLLYSMDYNVHNISTEDAKFYKQCLIDVLADITGITN